MTSRPCHPLAQVWRNFESGTPAGTYRVVYTARLDDAVYVLHAFQKRTRATSRDDVALARKRFRDITGRTP